MRTCRILLFLGLPILGVGSALADSADWPGLRGPDFDGSARTASLFPGGETGLEIGWKKAEMLQAAKRYSEAVAAYELAGNPPANLWRIVECAELPNR